MGCWQVGIIGGGPGGLMTAYCLQKHAQVPYRATLFEAGERLGGKILTNRFSHAPILYEAGAAELYDYSVVGHDPLRELVTELGLETTPMDGTRVVLDPHGPGWDPAAERALARFDQRARECMSPREFYAVDWKALPGDPLAGQTFQDLLDGIPDARARHYVRTLTHSDLATEPQRTNATYGLQNYLMNDPGYLRLYSIDGGIERLPQELARRIEAEVLLGQPVVRVERADRGRLRVTAGRAGERVEREFDFVVVALPNPLVPTLEWGGDLLADAIARHHAHFDHPAHYLRVTVLFERPFWRRHGDEAYFMLDAFDGCCVYDESSRNGADGYGVLGWLLGGEAALRLSRLPDDALVAQVLDALPATLKAGSAGVLEARVHRWVDAVNALPGGHPSWTMEARHIPEPTRHANLLLVGDYLFDSTLNGVLDSADFVAEWLAGEMTPRRGSRLAHDPLRVLRPSARRRLAVKRDSGEKTRRPSSLPG